MLVLPPQAELRDPVALLLGRAPSFLGNLSYAQYVLQFVALPRAG